jgi:hypothetical protein
MKLTLNRTEEQERKLFKTIPVYYLHVGLEASADEAALIKKHKWTDWVLFEHVVHHSANVIEWTVGNLLGKPNKFGFATVEHLAHAESQIIETAKKLKQQLQAVSSFTSQGPREVEL